MKYLTKKILLAFLMPVLITTTILAQESPQQAKDAEYTKVITERAAKITATLGISEAKKASKVTAIIAGQYRNLNAIHESRDLAIKAIKEQQKDNKELIALDVKAQEEIAQNKLAELHKKYLKSLSKKLTPAQVELVKDGMTYKVLPITYKGYQEMLLNLTQEQNKQILAYLIEARELAMDAESSEKKHAWFGKYKGKINNYLSAQGYDMKQAGIDWQKRIKSAEAGKKIQ